jgi:hypothetical protein
MIGAPCPYTTDTAPNQIAQTAKSIANVPPRADPQNSLITIKMPNPAQRKNWRGTGGK